MCQSLVDIKWSDPPHAITAFVTVMLMPLTYSIAYGLIGGMMIWYSLQAVFFIMEKKFRIERSTEFRDVGLHEMKEIVKEEDNYETTARSMHVTENKDPQDSDEIGKEDIES